MKLTALVALLALASVAAPALSRGEEPRRRALAHDVYFTLNDASPQARQKLVDACHKYLTGHPGTAFFAAGTRHAKMQRDVNDTQFDVSLHVYFADQAAHDAYQEHPRHKQFIEEMRGNWKLVRVFDAWVEIAR